MQPVRALRAVRRLIADKEDTQQVFEIMNALAGKSIHKSYARLLETEEGGRQAYLRDELADKLESRDWLAQFPPGSVGAAYRAFIAPRQLSAYGLAAESRKVAEAADMDREHPLAWLARRLRDVHDLWHVLTGYGTDALGETCVVAFSYAQTRSLGFGFIALAGALEFSRDGAGLPYKRAVWQAYRNGRRAAWLPQEDYETLLQEPLEMARARLNIAEPTVYDSIPGEYRDQLPAQRVAQAA
jgi:ubiquinone biosynthesis protein COQ4